MRENIFLLGCSKYQLNRNKKKKMEREILKYINCCSTHDTVKPKKKKCIFDGKR